MSMKVIKENFIPRAVKQFLDENYIELTIEECQGGTKYIFVKDFVGFYIFVKNGLMLSIYELIDRCSTYFYISEESIRRLIEKRVIEEMWGKNNESK